MANILTGIRILCGLLILIFPPFSKWYYLFLLLGGFTDAVDGTVARSLGTATAFGAKFDTAADFIFLFSVLIRILTAGVIPTWLTVWIGLIAIGKASNAVIGFLKYGRFVPVHSVCNKICGAVVFIPPLLLGWDFAEWMKIAAVACACTCASIAAIRETEELRNGFPAG